MRIFFERFTIFGVFMCAVLSPAYPNIGTNPSVMERDSTVETVVSRQQLARYSLQVLTQPNKPYQYWSIDDHLNAFISLKRIVDIWREKKIADQYLVYGKQQEGGVPFTWEIVPYSTTTGFKRVWNQLVVLWRITFGGKEFSQAQRQELSDYEFSSDLFPSTLAEQNEKIHEIVRGNDAFCDGEIIDGQRVLEGKWVDVLYNYAPIKEFHFLIVPKGHKEKFSDLSQEEYQEAMEISRKLIDYFSIPREIMHFSTLQKIQDVYLFHKTGRCAGQNVEHWHLHMVFTANETQGFLGKLKVLKNMLIGASPMNRDRLREKVESLSVELEEVQREIRKAL